MSQEAVTPTQAEAVQPAPTTPEAVATLTPVIEKTQKSQAKTFSQEDVDRMIAERLKRDRMDALEKAKAEKDDLTKELETLKQQNLEAQRKLALSGKVVDVDAATKLLSDEFLVDGQVQLEPFLAKYPFLKAQQTPSVAPGPGGRGSVPTGGLTKDQITRMTPEQINQRWEEVQQAMKG